MSIEKPVIRIADPELKVTTPARDYVEMVQFWHVLTASLRACISELNAIAPHGDDERLVNVQAQLQASANVAAAAVQQLLLLAVAQGLQVELPNGDLH